MFKVYLNMSLQNNKVILIIGYELEPFVSFGDCVTNIIENLGELFCLKMANVPN